MKSLEFNYYNIAALEPCYGEKGGNATRIYTTDGEIFEDGHRLQTVLKKIAAFYDRDILIMRRKYGKLLGCSLNVPLPFSPTLVLVSIKMRLPRFKQDGATGYINACQVEEVTAASFANTSSIVKCQIHLKGDHTLPCLHSGGNTEKRLNIANLALIHYKNKQFEKLNTANMVMEKADADAMDKVATISRYVYELLVNPQCRKHRKKD